MKSARNCIPGKGLHFKVRLTEWNGSKMLERSWNSKVFKKREIEKKNKEYSISLVELVYLLGFSKYSHFLIPKANTLLFGSGGVKTNNNNFIYHSN